MIQKKHLLIVDDDDKLRHLLEKYLKEQNFFVSAAESAEKARQIMRSFLFDLIVLDVMMPGETGFEFAKKIRMGKNTVPILMLTAMGETADKIKGS